ncbi:MAG TPA: 50S ribosomal protein L11 methyltransferase [Longimicrobiales bacterium]|nr:50S ribosomal protein L11 methyltransferase [Longimicrobiales bacterium]
MLTPAAWLCVRVPKPVGADPALVSEALIAAGGAAVQESAEALVTHLPLADGDVGGAVDSVRACLLRAGCAAGLRIDWTVEEDRDWAAEWKAGLRPRRVGRRFLLHPPWNVPDRAPGDLTIAIEPGMAFGTGEHATTRGALRHLESAVRPGSHVLDAGTGSGVLAIAAARLGARLVTAVDLDPTAVDVTRANASANGVDGVVRAAVRDVDGGFLAEAGPFDVIVANILSGVLAPLLPALRTGLSPAGALIVAGILEEEAADFLTAADAAGLAAASEDLEDGWWSARLEAVADGPGRTVAHP